MPEDVYVKRFFKKHPDSPYHDAINGFDPPPVRVFAWRVLEMKEQGVSEDDAMAVADEFDVRMALPLGVLNGALNVGVAAEVIYPLERGSTGSMSQLSERFYLGGNRSLVCRLDGPSSLLGFKARGLGRTDFRTCGPNNSENGASTSLS